MEDLIKEYTNFLESLSEEEKKAIKHFEDMYRKLKEE